MGGVLIMGRVSIKSVLISSVFFLATTGSLLAGDISNIYNSFNNSFNNLDDFAISDGISFDMVVSQTTRTCLPAAKAQVNVMPSGTAEDMFISATGLPPKTDFDFFVIQVPNAPFGLAWYQGGFKTNDKGNAVQHFRGRFSIKSFIVAPGIAAAPLVRNNPPFPNAAQNEATGWAQTYHLGLWFNAPTDAQNAGCPNTVTPFNGEHNAGIQVLNTSNYPDDSGPLQNVNR
jgi:hypothetical protein